MKKEIFDVNHPKVQLALVLKLQQLKRTQISTLTYNDLEDYLALVILKKETCDSLSQAVDLIWKIEAKDVIRFLSNQVIRDSAKKNLLDFAKI